MLVYNDVYCSRVQGDCIILVYKDVNCSRVQWELIIFVFNGDCITFVFTSDCVIYVLKGVGKNLYINFILAEKLKLGPYIYMKVYYVPG